jgi:hypothetical protein
MHAVTNKFIHTSVIAPSSSNSQNTTSHSSISRIHKYKKHKAPKASQYTHQCHCPPPPQTGKTLPALAAHPGYINTKAHKYKTHQKHLITHTSVIAPFFLKQSKNHQP